MFYNFFRKIQEFKQLYLYLSNFELVFCQNNTMRVVIALCLYVLFGFSGVPLKYY